MKINPINNTKMSFGAKYPQAFIAEIKRYNYKAAIELQNKEEPQKRIIENVMKYYTGMGKLNKGKNILLNTFPKEKVSILNLANTPLYKNYNEKFRNLKLKKLLAERQK